MSAGPRSAILASTCLVLVASSLGCRDISRFSSAGDHYEGSVVKGEFVRAGVAEDTRICLSIDADHLQDAPGKISSTDGRFRGEPLRPIPQLWHDPLSTLSFGEGREKNLVYVAASSTAFADGGDVADVILVVSLMTSGGVEVRMVRGAPPSATNIFAVFQLDRQPGACSF